MKLFAILIKGVFMSLAAGAAALNEPLWCIAGVLFALYFQREEKDMS